MSTRQLKPVSLSISAFVAGVLALPAAHAQEAAASASNDTAVAEVVVTAQKRVQTLREVPLSVSVVGGDALKKSAITALNDLAPRLSNVTLAPAASNDILTMRGIGSGFNNGFETAVGTFVDGVYRGRSRSVRIALFDVDRVEVLRGPQSTFFGNNAVAGAFNISTRRPDPGEPLQYNLSGLYGSTIGEYDIEGGISVPITDTLAARVALGYSGTDGWTRNDFTHADEPHADNRVGRLALAWTPSETLRSDLRFDYGRIWVEGQDQNEVTHCPPDPVLALPAKGVCAAYLAAYGSAADTTANYHGDAPPSFSHLRFNEAAWTNEFRLGSYTLTALSSYYDHEYEQASILIPVPITSPAGSKSWFDYHIGEDFDQFSQELRLQSPHLGRLSYMVGLYYQRSSTHDFLFAGPYFAPFGAFLPPALGYNASTLLVANVLDQRADRVYSGFAAATVDLTDKLKLNLGARYSVVDKEGHRSLTSGTATAEPISFATYAQASPTNQAAINGLLGFIPGDFPNTSRSDKNFMPSAGFQYEITPEISSYVSYGRGAKAGGWSIGTSANEFNDEKADAFEVGIKGDILGRRLFFSVAAFLSKYKDLQEASNNALPNGSFIILVGNVAKATAKGIETSLTWRATDRLSFMFDGAYLDSKYTDFPNAPCNTIQSAAVPVNCSQDLSDRTRPFAPNWSGSLGVSYATPLYGTNELRVEPFVYAKSKYYTLSTLDPLVLQPGYAKVDLRLGFGPAERNWEIAVVGRNLTDKKTAVFLNTLVSSPGSGFAQLDRPRTIAVQFNLRN